MGGWPQACAPWAGVGGWPLWHVPYLAATFSPASRNFFSLLAAILNPTPVLSHEPSTLYLSLQMPSLKNPTLIVLHFVHPLSNASSNAVPEKPRTLSPLP